MSQKSRRSNRPEAMEEDEVSPSLEDAIKECVRFIFCREGNKVPIKRAEIAKHMATACETDSKLVNRVLVEANKELKRVYGYKLIQVEARSGIQYIVVLDRKCTSLPSTVTDSYHRKLLVAALIHIYMSGGPVKEDEMWKFLSEAGLLEENDHAGRKILTNTFTRQMYLTFSKDPVRTIKMPQTRESIANYAMQRRDSVSEIVGEGDLARNVFEWGQRAIEEVPKMFLLNKMAEAFEKTPDYWCEQYREATEGTEQTSAAAQS